MPNGNAAEVGNLIAAFEGQMPLAGQEVYKAYVPFASPRGTVTTQFKEKYSITRERPEHG